MDDLYQKTIYSHTHKIIIIRDIIIGICCHSSEKKKPRVHRIYNRNRKLKVLLHLVTENVCLLCAVALFVCSSLFFLATQRVYELMDGCTLTKTFPKILMQAEGLHAWKICFELLVLLVGEQC